jgi:Ca2+-binding RTX toxin-like protein
MTRRPTIGLTAAAVLAVSTLHAPVAPAAPPDCFGSTPTIVGTPNNDVIVGTTGRDVIVALDGDDDIRALAGNDVVCGGLGDDTIRGGPGSNNLLGGPGNDVLIGGPEYDQLIGGAGGDRLVAGAGDTAIMYGEAGDDWFEVWEGTHNEVLGGNGRDTVSFGRSPTGVTVRLDANVFYFAGTKGGIIYGTERVRGSGHPDVLVGDPFRNYLNGRGGADTLRGGYGNDRLFGAPGSDTLHGNMGDDYLDGGAHYDVVYGGAGGDTCANVEEWYGCEAFPVGP